MPSDSDAQLLQSYAAAWRTACADFVALMRDLPEEEWSRPTELPGWTVRDVVAHTAHLEAVLAGAPEETEPAPEAEHVRDFMGLYTEQGVHARRERTPTELLDELEAAVETRAAELEADPPTDGAASPPRTPGGVPWTFRTLLSNRVVDVWMHEQDVRRAVDRPGGFDSDAARHTVRAFLSALPMVVGKRAKAPADATVVVELVDEGTLWPLGTGDDGRVRVLDGAPARPTTQLRMTAETFVLLAGGRRPVDDVAVEVIGDADLGRRVLDGMAVTP